MSLRSFVFGAITGYLVYLILSSTVAHAEEAPLLFIDDVITYQSVAPIKKELEAHLQSKSRADIDILIDSPGGSVTAGQEIINLINAVKGKKRKVNCYVLNVAASMAFQIFTQCLSRYALPGSYLLWHGVRVETSQPITADVARDLAAAITQLNRLVIYQLSSTIHLKADVIMEHFHKETLWSGVSLNEVDPKFLKLSASYPSLISRLPKAVRTKKQMSFFFQDSYEFVYIWYQYRKPK